MRSTSTYLHEARQALQLPVGRSFVEHEQDRKRHVQHLAHEGLLSHNAQQCECENEMKAERRKNNVLTTTVVENAHSHAPAFTLDGIRCNQYTA